jgi:hypothetical protein
VFPTEDCGRNLVARILGVQISCEADHVAQTPSSLYDRASPSRQLDGSVSIKASSTASV